MTASFDDSADYAIGIVLPDLCQYSTSHDVEIGHFTEAQARQLPLQSLPVRFQHKDGKSFHVGIIEDGRVSKLQHRILLRVNPSLGPEALTASNALANGMYPSLSLSHQVPRNQVPAADGSLFKRPFEVSLVDEPWRPGSDISHVFPGRASLERFSDDTLRQFHRRFYTSRIEEPPQCDKTSQDHSRYIDRLWTLVRSDRDSICAEHALSATHSPLSTTSKPMSTTTVVEPVAPPAAEVRGSAQLGVVEPPPPQQQQQEVAAELAAPETPAQQQQRTDLRDPLATATKLVETEEALDALKSKNAELLAYKQQVDDAKAAEQKQLLLKANTVAESFAQWAEKEYGADFASAQRLSLDAQIAANPNSAIEAMTKMRETLVAASNDRNDANKRAIEERQRADRAAHEAAFSSLEHRRHVMTSPGFSSAPPAPAALPSSLAASMSSRFVGDSPPLASTPAQSVAPPVPTPSQPQQALAAAASYGHEVHEFVEESPGHIEVRASVEANRKRPAGWARTSFEVAKRSLHEQNIDKEPTFSDTAFGYVANGTTEVRAGAGGGVAHVMNIEKSFTGPQRFGMAEFAPKLFERLLSKQRGRTHEPLDGETMATPRGLN